MEKIKVLTDEQLINLRRTKTPKRFLKDIIGLKPNDKYEIGDTAVKIDNAKQGEIYKYNHNGKFIYYTIIRVLNEEQSLSFDGLYINYQNNNI